MAAARKKKPRTSDCDAKIKQATAAKPAQLNREEIEEVAISSDKELEQELGTSPLLPSETIVFAIHFGAGTNDAAALRACKGIIGQKLITRVTSFAPSGEGHVVPSMMLPSIYHRQGEPGLWVQIRVAAPPGTLKAVVGSPFRCQDYLCLGSVTMDARCTPVDLAARIVDIHKVLPTVHTITGVPPQLRPSVLHRWLADAYKRSDADFTTAQREGHTAAITVILPEGAQPLPEFRSWRWPTEHGLRRGSLRASRRPAPQLGLTLSIEIPQHHPGTKEEAATARKAAAQWEWDAARVRAAAADHRQGSPNRGERDAASTRVEVPTVPPEDDIQPASVGLAVTAAALSVAATAASKPAAGLQSWTTGPVATMPKPVIRSGSAPSSPIGVQPRSASKDLEGWMQQQLHMMSQLPPLPQSPPSPEPTSVQLQEELTPAQPLIPQPQSWPQRQPQQGPLLPMSPTCAVAGPSTASQPVSQGRSQWPKQCGKTAALKKKLLAVAADRRAATLVRETSPRTREYLENGNLNEFEQMTEDELGRYLSTLGMRVGSAASRKIKAKKQRVESPSGKG